MSKEIKKKEPEMIWEYVKGVNEFMDDYIFPDEKKKEPETVDADFEIIEPTQSPTKPIKEGI